MAIPNMLKGMGRSSKEVAPKKARAQNQAPKYSVSAKAFLASASIFSLMPGK
jgi:hypothetical protein